jgi:uncharacterized protein (TIGR03435 family)
MIWAALLAASALCQDARPTYEVASVKLNNSGSGNTSSRTSKGQISITNMSLRSVLVNAYQVKEFQIEGAAWLDDVRVDIVAKYPPDTKIEERALMLRALLEDRFHLAVHMKQREMQGYALVVAKGGFKLKPVEETNGGSTSSNGGRVRKLVAKQMPIPGLADFIARNIGEMVVDQTGIEGVYDLEIRFTADDQKPDDTDPAPSLFTAVQETLGLRLKPEKIPVPIVVIDSIERAPIEN